MGKGKKLAVRRVVLLLALVMSATMVTNASLAQASIGNLSLAVADDGAKVIAETPVDAQMVDLTIASPALKTNGMVRLVLPHDYFTDPTATWPTLYMLEGAGAAADYASWTTYTDFESFMAPKDVLSVLPTDGQAGFTSAEYDGGAYTGPNYQIFTGVEIPQILERAYRSSGRNAVAGLSIGGLGAIDLAAEYPGQYKAVASYSGLLDTQLSLGYLVVDGARVRDGFGIDTLWGDPLLNANIWTAHDPIDQVTKLRGLPIFISSGNGLPGPYDNPADLVATVEGGFLEGAAQLANSLFYGAALLAGDNVTTDFYGPGTHTWPYWQREFQRSWPLLATGLGVPTS